MGFLALALAFVTNGVANVLLKVGADRGVSLDLSRGVGQLLAQHVFLLGGMVLFVINLMFYIYALRTLPLSVAYPIMVGMSFLVANTLAVLYLNEALSWQHLLGYVLILTGISLVVTHGA